jgi:hypothetical protein
MIKDIFTVDNLFHSLVCTGIVLVGWYFVGYAPLFALGAGVGVYLREVGQVDGDFSLNHSVHKWHEATVGPLVGLVVSAVVSLL